MGRRRQSSSHIDIAEPPPAADDLDGDGDVDVVVSITGWPPGQVGPSDYLAWFENTDGAGDFGSEQTIYDVGEGSIFASFGVRVIQAHDLDGDGDRDVLASYSRLEFFPTQCLLVRKHGRARHVRTATIDYYARGQFLFLRCRRPRQGRRPGRTFSVSSRWKDRLVRKCGRPRHVRTATDNSNRLSISTHPSMRPTSTGTTI